jgi:hypothetical protein
VTGGSATGRSGPRGAAWIVALAILVASLANGAYGYLARLGVLDRAQFQQIVDTHCSGPGAASAALALSCHCIRIQPGIDYSVAPWPDYLFKTEGYRFAFKLAKEVLFAGLLAWSLFAIRRWRPAQAVPRAWPLLLFLAVVAVGVLRTALAGNPVFALMGSRPFEFAAVAATAAWLSPYLGTVARPLSWLLFLEAALVGAEMLFGMPMRSCPNSFRAAGTMVLPNSLGIVVAMLMAFAASFRPRLARNPWSWLAAAWLVIASGSGTGVLLLLVLACLIAAGRLPRDRRVAAFAAASVLVAMLVLALPTLTQRPQIFDSLFGVDGRVDKALSVLGGADPTTALLGTGIGPGSNVAVNLASVAPTRLPKAIASSEPFFPDSTVTMLLRPLGIIGVLAWYLMLGWGFVVDRRARPFYVLAALASLVISLPELFPANLLLGLVLAHSLVRTGALRRKPA